MMSERVALKIYGERNTGTNYLTELTERNLIAHVLPGRVAGSDLRTRLTRRLRALAPSMMDRLHEAARDRYFEATFSENLGWKHMNPSIERIGPEALANVRFLMLVKNPYAWLLSLFNQPYHVGGRDGAIEVFIKRRLPVMERRENVGTDPLLPVEVWNRKMRGYLALQEAATHAQIVKYEAFLSDEEATLREVAEKLGIAVKATVTPVAQGVKDADRDVPHSAYADYYLNERWQAKLTPGAVEQINEGLDADLVARMGYQMLSPDDIG